MDRLSRIIAVSVIVIFLTFTSAATGYGANPCVKCHEKTYEKALSYEYQHSVVFKQCPVCHIDTVNEDAPVTTLDFQTMQKDWIVPLDELSKDNKYLAKIVVTDSGGRTSDHEGIDIDQKSFDGCEPPLKSLKLKKLKNVVVNEIIKRSFVLARISWDTDVAATSEIEYWQEGSSSMSKSNKKYTGKHLIVLDDLKQKSTYKFRAVSSDIYGRTLKSKELTLNTSEEYSEEPLEVQENLIRPQFNDLRVFESHTSDELYLKVNVNKPVELSVTIKEAVETGEKHGDGLLSERFSKIDACYTCHPHGSSHPVGVKAESPKIRTPDGLPTIEDGIITCVTCHYPHGGDKVYYNRFDSNKDLCMRCHLEKYGG